MARRVFGGLSELVSYDKAISHLPPGDLVEIEGQRIHVRVSGEGPTLILLHGFMASAYTFREIIPVLQDSFRVVSIDLNGFGYTERPKSARAYRIQDQADLIVRVMEKIGLPPGIIVGHSYGGMVASVIAVRHPDSVQKLILVSPPSGFDRLPWYLHSRIGQELLYLLCRRVVSNPKRYKALSSRAFFREGILTDEVSETYRNQLLIEGARSSFFGIMEALMAGEFPGIDFRDLEHPALVLAGEQDAVVRLESCRSLAAKFRRGRLEVIPDCGHSAFEERPDEVIEAIRRFYGEMSQD